ncbi:MAG: 4Fe-4S binding protein [Proteobacteria bacterium]|nr:4Fe-4S binding protein [Pseudomonadota bacterium]
MAAKSDNAKCTGCGNCVEVCPVEAIALKDDKAVIDAVQQVLFDHHAGDLYAGVQIPCCFSSPQITARM